MLSEGFCQKVHVFIKKMSVLFYIFEKNIDNQILKDFSGFSLCKKAKLPTESKKLYKIVKLSFKNILENFERLMVEI